MSAAFDYSQDFARLTEVRDRVAVLMRDGRWRTHPEVAAACRCTENGAAARLREFRQVRFAHYGVSKVEKRRRGGTGNLWEYRCVFAERVTDEHLEFATQFFRSEGQRPSHRAKAVGQLEALSHAETWPEGTAATWAATIKRLVEQGVLSAQGERVAYVLRETSPRDDRQEMLF